MMAAICEQVLDDSRFFWAVRLIMGLEIVAVFLNLILGSGFFGERGL